jgi:hypothetical protein
MAWNTARKAHEEAPQGGIWFKLEDGQKVDVTFLGEPLEVMEKADWQPSGEALRFQFNLARLDNLGVQVWSLSPRVFGRLLSMHDEDQVAGCKITVKRRGTGKDTEYDLFAKGALDKATLRKIGKLGLIELPAGDDTVAVGGDEAPEADDEAPAKAAKATKAAKSPADEARAKINAVDDPDEVLDVARSLYKATKDKALRAAIMAAKDARIEFLESDPEDDDDVPF